MAFIESDRVQIRIYMGYSALWLQLDPRLESAITNVQAIVDGGTRPDNSTELAIKSVITKLQLIDSQIDLLAQHQGATRADQDVSIDDARELSRLRSVGRQYVHRLSRFFDSAPRADVFSQAPDIVGELVPYGGRSGY